MAAPARSVVQLFTDAVQRPDAEIDLARAALLLAKEEYPQISLEQYLLRFDQLAEEVRGRLDNETAPVVALRELIGVLYERHGFRGNQEAYHDPRNSYLNDVLDRRTGIPLTLGIVLLEVGWRLDLPLEGVNFPLHFLVRFRGDAFDLLVDPFDHGRLRFQDEAQSFLDQVYGGRVRVKDFFLRPATRKDMLLRLLGNLQSLYANAGDGERLRRVTERLAAMSPAAE